MITIILVITEANKSRLKLMMKSWIYSFVAGFLGNAGISGSEFIIKPSVLKWCLKHMRTFCFPLKWSIDVTKKHVLQRLFRHSFSSLQLFESAEQKVLQPQKIWWLPNLLAWYWLLKYKLHTNSNGILCVMTYQWTNYVQLKIVFISLLTNVIAFLKQPLDNKTFWN